MSGDTGVIIGPALRFHYSGPVGTGANMKTIGNLLWFALAGFWLAIGYIISGIIACVLVITIPFGIASFRLAGYTLWPFGRVVIHKPDRDVALSAVGNVIWFFIGGLWLALGHILLGLLLCVTIIGIPFGVASLRMAGLALAPFGKQVVKRNHVPAGATIVAAPPESR